MAHILFIQTIHGLSVGGAYRSTINAGTFTFSNDQGSANSLFSTRAVLR